MEVEDNTIAKLESILENGICKDCRWYSMVGVNCKHIEKLPIDLMSCDEFNWD